MCRIGRDKRTILSTLIHLSHKNRRGGGGEDEEEEEEEEDGEPVQ